MQGLSPEPAITLAEGHAERPSLRPQQCYSHGPMEPVSHDALAPDVADLTTRVDLLRLEAGRSLDPGRRAEMGQFFTPAPVAGLMASMFSTVPANVRVLDPGAGAGALTAALVARVCSETSRPRSIHVTAFEADAAVRPFLAEALEACAEACRAADVSFEAEVRDQDFVEGGVGDLTGDLLFREVAAVDPFDVAIINPPYRKINTDSRERMLLRRIGVETSNLYSAFLAVALKLLKPGGEMVAITPRSFCNGPYFRPFRQVFLREMGLRRVHVFESREHAFSDDEVLQENVIFSAVRMMMDRPDETSAHGDVRISSSHGPDEPISTERVVPYAELVRPDDPDYFIRIPADEIDAQLARQIEGLNARLQDLGLSVSTGRVVDFRAREHLRADPGDSTVPLVYPTHLEGAAVRWPKVGKKPNALAVSDDTRALMVPSETYVLVKRFSAKEEKRRVVAAVYDPASMPAGEVGLENHLNYFHQNGRGIQRGLALGLCAYLNSTVLDAYFRLFNGHTQVNATDLRSLRYPTREALVRLGGKIPGAFPEQHALDALVEEELGDMAGTTSNPAKVKGKVAEALSMLRELGLPRAQQNERSALTLLALLNVTPNTAWAEVGDPMLGITERMDFFAAHYGKRYAPNSRETVRRQTVHQFLEAGLLMQNPDDPTRPTNSGLTVYRVREELLALARTFGTPAWEEAVRRFRGVAGTLAETYAQAREMSRIPVRFEDGQTITLSVGGQNPLVKEIVETFCPQFTPGGTVVYVGDTGDKQAYFNEALLGGMGVVVDKHGKMPDVVVFHRAKGWMVLIEAVTSHGPVDPKRRTELKHLFKGAEVGLVFVTAFMDRKTLVKYVREIAWETEVWIAEEPGHLIHFNGERFLGPYDELGR